MADGLAVTVTVTKGAAEVFGPSGVVNPAGELTTGVVAAIIGGDED